MPSRVDRQMLATSMLAERLAQILPSVRDHVAEELAAARAAGYPSESFGHGPPDPGPVAAIPDEPCHQNHPDDPDRGCIHRRPCPVHDRPVSLTSVEQAADQALRIRRWYEDVEAAQKLIALTVSDALRNCEKLLGMRSLTVVRLCDCTGREGASVPQADGGWSDPACHETAEKSGLCNRCYMNEYRWRKREGLPTRDRSDLREAV